MANHANTAGSNLNPTLNPVALVTGANRGLGFETCRQLGRKGFKIVLTARDAAKGREAAETLRGEKIDVTPIVLDVDSEESARQAAKLVREKFGRLDVLVNNAGILPDEDASESPLKVPASLLRETFETNVLGPYRMFQAFAPLLIETAAKPAAACRVVNVSSGMGQLSEMNGGYPAYRVSKTALNALTRIFSEELSPRGILVNSICPGWVKTDMGGPGASLTPEQGVDTIVWAATLPSGGPTGGFFRERERIDW